eukprot:4206170-Pleurochrysis_carterae.AAC.2
MLVCKFLGEFRMLEPGKEGLEGFFTYNWPVDFVSEQPGEFPLRAAILNGTKLDHPKSKRSSCKAASGSPNGGDWPAKKRWSAARCASPPHTAMAAARAPEGSKTEVQFGRTVSKTRFVLVRDPIDVLTTLLILFHIIST